VKTNRSVPSATVIPVLVYPDVRAAVAWLEDALGFKERVQIGEDHRSQMRFGDGALIVADVRDGHRSAPGPEDLTHQVMLRVEDANELCEQAREHGAKVLMEPEDFEYGERQCSLEDPWGHRWTLTQTLRDVAPEEFGAILKS
jgi:uncharacterized glyoxalase superfamily protein PhnB